jgi:hypothetical protein
MGDGHVRVLHEVRSLLKDLRPTIRNLRSLGGAGPLDFTTASRRKKGMFYAEVERLLSLCEELSELLWVKEAGTGTNQPRSTLPGLF